MAYQRRQQQPRRRDVKERTMNRFAALDEDIVSRYDDLDDDDRNLPINHRATFRPPKGGNSVLAGVMRRTLARQAQGVGKRDQIFQVTVRNGGRGGIRFVAQALSEHVEKFLPFSMETDVHKNVTFFVLTEEDADDIRFLNRRLSYPPNSNEKISIYHKRANAPWESLPTNIKKAVKDVVTSRYNATSNSLDLSAFQHDRIFMERDVNNLTALTRNAVMVEVVKVIADQYPKITGLSLKNNRLSLLDTAFSLTYAAPNVVELDLSDNQISNVSSLEKLNKWAIERLHLENNPLCANFADASSYTSAVHDYFPRVSYLDGSVVHCNPHKINADNQRRAGIPYPQVQPGYCPTDVIKQRIEQLLIQYFDIYDDPQPAKSRQQLIQAYDEDATFTHVLQFLPDTRQVPKGDEDAYRQYMRSSHNILHEDKWQNYRDKIVYRGAMEVAVALSQLPKTQHVRESFVMDIVYFGGNLLVFNVRGILRDGAEVDQPPSSACYKFFSRTMAVVPKTEDKMAIVNDQLSLTPINSERMERYNKMLKKTLEAPVDPQPAPTVNSIDMSSINLAQQPGPSGLQNVMRQEPQQQAPPPTPAYDRNDPNVQMQMVEAFSRQSGMKPEWSRKCLEDLQWDFEGAGRAFNEFRSSIPPEAFQ